ncbi:MAG: PilZ domain-containing protein [Desulfomonile tiedjei]|nr:PilZ domain-containing protein [Desulfomonile tiedjei]
MSGREIRVKEVLADIKEGVDDSTLMEKYKLSPKGLEDLFRQLASANLLDRVRQQSSKQSEGQRRSSRHTVDFVLPVYSEDESQVVGTVLDLTENGIGTRGIRARVNDLKTLVIPADEYFDVGRLRVLAYCRWAARDPSDGEHLAGFEIGELSSNDSLELKKLIDLSDSFYCQEVDEAEEFDEAVEADGFEEVDVSEESATGAEHRSLVRHAVPFQIPIHDAIRRENRGKLVDITEEGFAVDGMTCEKGVEITLVIPAYHYGRQRFDSMVLIAKCRWVKRKESGGYLCGFQITDRTTKNYKELQRLVRACAEG